MATGGTLRNLLRFAWAKVSQNPIVKPLLQSYKFSWVKRGRLVGTDQFGNKYYEAPDELWGRRNRWVEAYDYRNFDASLVPPEWHGWLHNSNDIPGHKLAQTLRPIYKEEHRPNLTGTDKIYVPHNYVLNSNFGKPHLDRSFPLPPGEKPIEVRPEPSNNSMS